MSRARRAGGARADSQPALAPPPRSPGPPPPRRCAFGTLNQLCLLPAIFLVAWLSAGRSMGGWERVRLHEQLRAAVRAAQGAAEEARERLERLAAQSDAAALKLRLERMAAESCGAAERIAHGGRETAERLVAEGRHLALEGREKAERFVAEGRASGGRLAAEGSRLAAEVRDQGLDAAERLAASVGAHLAAAGFSAAERAEFKAAEAEGGVGSPLKRPVLTAVSEVSFCTVFAAFMICDLLFVPASALLVAHHAACLVCHFWAIFTRPRGALLPSPPPLPPSPPPLPPTRPLAPTLLSLGPRLPPRLAGSPLHSVSSPVDDF